MENLTQKEMEAIKKALEELGYSDMPCMVCVDLWAFYAFKSANIRI